MLKGRGGVACRAALLLGAGVLFGAACGETNENPADSASGSASAGAPGAGQAAAEGGKVNGSAGSTSAGTSSAGRGGSSSAGGSPAVGGAPEPNLAGAGGDKTAASGSGSGGAPDTCEQTCQPEQSGFCGQGEVTWGCPNFGYDHDLFVSECHDAGTNAVRFCCSPNFTGECPK